MPAGDDSIRDELLQRCPVFRGWIGGVSVIEPFRRGVMVDLQSEMDRLHGTLAADVANLRTADTALAAGASRPRGGRSAAALASFEKAVQAVPGCQRASAEADRCRRLLEDRQAMRDEARALVAEAQKSALLAQWGAVVALCDKALTLDCHDADASGLRAQAAKALESEVRERRRAEQTAAAREEALNQAKAAEAALANSEPERALELAESRLSPPIRA